MLNRTPDSKVAVLNQPLRVDVLLEQGYENGVLRKSIDEFRNSVDIDFGEIRVNCPYFEKANPEMKTIHLELSDLSFDNALTL